MLKISVLCLLVPAAFAQKPAADPVRSAATRAIAVVERGASGFYKSQECFSCHDHSLPLMAFQMARERGLPVDEAAVAGIAAKGLLHGPDLSSIDRAVQDPMIVDPAVSEGWALVAAGVLGIQPNTVTGAIAQRIANWQRADGHYPTLDARPPQSYSLITATAVASRVVRQYLPAALRTEKEKRLARAREWLLSATARSTEDATFRLFGLAWTGAGAEDRARAARELLSLQHPDGGWSELAYMAPDAYSTGEALVALADAGAVPVTDAAWRKGVEFLLSSQQDDGSWHVRTRNLSPAAVSPPYFESGFPYGHDQFISTAATSWAAMALLTALPKMNAARPPVPSALQARDLKPWMDTALFGTPAELQALLEGGLDPNSRTAQGTTLLMMAAHDPAKVKLLLGRGADARIKAKSGFNALTVAATYQGTAGSVKLLLAAGAEARPGTGVLFNASPLFMATLTGDPANIALLKTAGADPNRPMNILGMFPTAPLLQAIFYPEPATTESLLAAGAHLKEPDPDGMTALHWAVLTHHPAEVKALLAAGADVNAVDKHGYTPLLYAATVDFGDSEIADVLLRAGADPNIKAKDGKTALMQAHAYPDLRASLEKAGARE